MIVGLEVWQNVVHLFIVFDHGLAEILMSHNKIVLYVYIPYFHVSNSALFFRTWVLKMHDHVYTWWHNAAYLSDYQVGYWASVHEAKLRFITKSRETWWHHQMGTLSALLALCAGNSPVTGEFPAQRPVTRSFDAFFDLRQNKRLSKQSRGWWFETPSRSLWCHCNVLRVRGID